MAFDAFLKIGDVKGESSDSKFKDQIEVQSFSWGISQSGSAGYGSGGGSGKASVQALTVVKRIDKSSPVLFQACAEGSHYSDATLVCRKAGGTQLVYLTIKLSDVLITSVQPGGSAQGGEEIPLESISMDFAKCTMDYQPQGPDGKAAGGPIHGGWDISKNVKA